MSLDILVAYAIMDSNINKGSVVVEDESSLGGLSDLPQRHPNDPVITIAGRIYSEDDLGPAYHMGLLNSLQFLMDRGDFGSHHVGKRFLDVMEIDFKLTDQPQEGETAHHLWISWREVFRRNVELKRLGELTEDHVREAEVLHQRYLVAEKLSKTS